MEGTIRFKTNDFILMRDNMKRVYVAGPYSANNVLDVLKNIGRGRHACAQLFELGYAPFCPWHDESFVTDNPEGSFTIDHFYQYSMAWLEVSDALVVLSEWRGWETSKGTAAEIRKAIELDIPVYYGIDEFLRCEDSIDNRTFTERSQVVKKG